MPPLPDAIIFTSPGARLTLIPANENWIAEAETAWFHARTPVRFASEDARANLERLLTSGAGATRISLGDAGEIEAALGKRNDIVLSVRIQAAPDFLHEIRLVIQYSQPAFRAVLEAWAGTATNPGPGG